MTMGLLQRCKYPCQPGEYREDLVRGKRVLVVGSGRDLDGRGLGSAVDRGDWDIVIRANKVYGDPLDCGSRTDVLVIRRVVYLESNPEFLPERAHAHIKAIIGIEDHKGYTGEEFHRLTQRLGSLPSTGMCAVMWALDHGAESVDVIGFGWRDGAFAGKKSYSTGSPTLVPKILTSAEGVDLNPYCNWDKENAMLLSLEKLNLID